MSATRGGLHPILTGCLLSGWLSLSLAGCAIGVPELDPKSVLRRHYIVAHEDGQPVTGDTRLFRRDLTGAEYETQLDGILGGIDQRARRLWDTAGDVPPERRTPLRLLVFVHGGLNGYQDDFDRMVEMMPGYGARREGEPAEQCPERQPTDARYPLFVSTACDEAKSAFYPLFVNWNSGLPDSISDDLLFIRFGRRLEGTWKGLGLLTMPFVLAARLTESVLRLPSSVWVNVERFWDGDPDAGDVVQGVLMSPVRLVTTPILKAFGTSAWEIMKRRASLLTAERLPDRGTGVTEGAAHGLFKRLAARVVPLGAGLGWRIGSPDAGPSGPVELTLVGHSMGAIVLNRLIATEIRLPVTRIVYLAPASSNYEIELLLEPLLRRIGDEVDARGGGIGKTEFWMFALHQHDENLETRPLSFILPRGTLLAWIDNYFEPIASAGDQRFGRYQAYRQYFQPAGRAVETGVTGLRPCEWARADPGRPVRHDELDAKDILERILWTVDPDAFDDWRTRLAALGRSVPIDKVVCEDDPAGR